MSIERIRAALADPALNDKSAPVADVAEAICGLIGAARAVAIRELLAERDALAAENERKDELLQQLRQWSEAYPLDIFPEPDFARAHAVLQAAGMTLDAISASNMRHVITKVREMIDAAKGKE